MGVDHAGAGTAVGCEGAVVGGRRWAESETGCRGFMRAGFLLALLVIRRVLVKPCPPYQ